MFVFYDIETTGTNIAYDQILQFAAILVDDNLVELDRFEIRCRLLPWVVPAPSALLVTGITVDQLEDPRLPSFYEMMKIIAARLASWRPATFIGYNSMLFDERFLQRAFWQSLLPPYVTVMGGNARIDLLPIIRLAAYIRPGVLKVPTREDGSSNFRLDAIAPENAFGAYHAHDAMGDVEATLFLARRIAIELPSLWQPLVARASKLESAAAIPFGKPIYLFRHRGTPPIACCQRIDTCGARGSHAVLARLDFDWRGSRSRIDDPTESNAALLRSSLHRIALNRAPVMLSLAEAELLGGLVPSSAELFQGQFLATEIDYCLRLVDAITGPTIEKSPDGAEVEETIFDAFASAHDELLMARFHRADAPRQALIANDLIDERFRRLAMRVLYVTAPTLLSEREMKIVRLGIARRLGAGNEEPHAWRSVADALGELDNAPELAAKPQAAEIMNWLAQRLLQSQSKAEP